jgi:phage-related protein
MATFDDATVGTSTGGTTPDFRASKKSEPAVRSVQFGDGYQQRITFGLNQIPKEWDLTWTAKTTADADAIEAFFDARGGQESFDWAPLDDATPYKWVVASWTRTFDYANISTINATFREVFEP